MFAALDPLDRVLIDDYQRAFPLVERPYRMIGADLDIPETEVLAAVSTGHLPDPDTVARLVREAYERYVGNDEGTVADYIPALARVNRSLFGFSIVGVNGAVHEIGDARHAFSI